MSSKRTIAIVGNFNLKQLNASGKRVKGLADAISHEYDVVFIGCHQELCFTNIECKEGEYAYAFFPYATSIKLRVNVKAYVSYTLSILKKIPNLDGVILYGSPVLSIYMQCIMNWCRKNHIAIISDCVDMIFKTGQNGVKDLIKNADVLYQKTKLIPKADGIIAISRTIEKYYQEKNCKDILIVPPITQKKNILTAKSDSIIKIVYAGIPFNKIKNISTSMMKDRLDIAIEYVIALKKRNIPVKFYIYGISQEEYLFSVPKHRTLIDGNGSIFFYGRTDNSVIEESIAAADFTILCRDKTFVTQSGFPTKFTESLSLGVPVIATNTSDLKDYLMDGKNGVFVDYKVNKKSVDKLQKAVKNITIMKNYCRDNYVFNPELYSSSITEFIKKVVAKVRN